MKSIVDSSDILTIKPNFDIVKLIPRETAMQYQTILYTKNDKTYECITTNKFPDQLHQIITQFEKNDHHVHTIYTDEIWFGECMHRYDQIALLDSQNRTQQTYRDQVRWDPALELLHTTYAQKSQYKESDFIIELIRLAFQAGASDLHRQSEQDGMHLRIRKDGILQHILTIWYAEYITLSQTIKFLSWVKLNILHTPQDGRMRFTSFKNSKPIPIDVRVSIMPGMRSENVVMRFLDSSKTTLKLTELWFEQDHLEILTRQLTKTSGMIIVTWPTWSGKTTTLYSMLNILNQPTKKIITLEDPIEYEIPGIQQSQINEEEWYTFEEWLTSILRQDPDCILIWEIRSLQTAQIAINAALTWHLVLTTLHTNSAIESLNRLLNLWVPAYLLWPSINCIIWQRLVRILKPDLAPYALNDIEAKELNTQPWSAYPRWTYDETIYSWRSVVAEVCEFDDRLKAMISAWKSAHDMDISYRTMLQDWYLKISHHTTTLKELRRVI